MKAFAKINLFLKILARRSDGMHEIASRFCLLDDYFDEVFLVPKSAAQEFDGDSVEEFFAQFDGFCQDSFSKTPSKKLVEFLPKMPTAQAPNVLCDRLILHQNCLANFYAPNNLLAKISQFLPPKTAQKMSEFCFVIIKSIPIFAGLGGGSSDAAAALKLLVRKGILSCEEADKIAPKIGADVAFFYSGAKCANVGGIGEIIEPIDDELPPISLHFARPCSTPLVFAEFAAAPKYFGGKKALFDLKNRDIFGLKPEFANDLLPAVLRIYTLDDRFRAQNIFLSGSGGSFFTICNKS